MNIFEWNATEMYKKGINITYEVSWIELTWRPKYLKRIYPVFFHLAIIMSMCLGFYSSNSISINYQYINKYFTTAIFKIFDLFSLITKEYIFLKNMYLYFMININKKKCLCQNIWYSWLYRNNSCFLYRLNP